MTRVEEAEIWQFKDALWKLDLLEQKEQVEAKYGRDSPRIAELLHHLEALEDVPDALLARAAAKREQVRRRREQLRQPLVGGTYWKADGTPVIVSPFERPNA